MNSIKTILFPILLSYNINCVNVISYDNLDHKIYQEDSNELEHASTTLLFVVHERQQMHKIKLSYLMDKWRPQIEKNKFHIVIAYDKQMAQMYDINEFVNPLKLQYQNIIFIQYENVDFKEAKDYGVNIYTHVARNFFLKKYTNNIVNVPYYCGDIIDSNNFNSEFYSKYNILYQKEHGGHYIPTIINKQFELKGYRNFFSFQDHISKNCKKEEIAKYDNYEDVFVRNLMQYEKFIYNCERIVVANILNKLLDCGYEMAYQSSQNTITLISVLNEFEDPTMTFTIKLKSRCESYSYIDCLFHRERLGKFKETNQTESNQQIIETKEEIIQKIDKESDKYYNFIEKSYEKIDNAKKCLLDNTIKSLEIIKNSRFNFNSFNSIDELRENISQTILSMYFNHKSVELHEEENRINIIHEEQEAIEILEKECKNKIRTFISNFINKNLNGQLLLQ